MKSDLLFRELHFQSQWISEAVRYIGKARQQVDVDDFWFRELLLQWREVASVTLPGARVSFSTYVRAARSFSL